MDAPPPSGRFDGGCDLCVEARRDAARAAVWRKVCPDAFDARGDILTGQFGRVVVAVAAAGYNPATGARIDD
jgi:hypothetical protein